MLVNNPRIGILIPTVLKDKILMKTINSILDVYQDNWVILVADQNKPEDYSLEKKLFYGTACAEAHKSLRNQERIKVLQLPFDCGLPKSRNELVKLADSMGIKYVLMSADSIAFTESMKKINYLTKYLNYSKDFNIDLLGFDLLDRISWEAYLEVNEAFILDFIDKTPMNALLDRYCDKSFTIYKCDIVRNFFLATTKSLLNVPWDENVKMSEHEDEFVRYKLKGYNVGWTNCCAGQYLKSDDNTYKKLRSKNIAEGKKYFTEKYNLKQWFKYINFQNIKR